VPDPLLPLGEGHTELGPDEQTGLRPSYITSRGELNDAEQRSIAAALLNRRPPTWEQLLDDVYLRALHKAMFGAVWAWAGKYRTKETKISVDPIHIGLMVRELVADARAWAEFATFEPDELALRFHHRLVWIHPFVNGNGRHGRVSADYLARALDRPPFSWGAHRKGTTEALREAYLDALRSADRDDPGPLMIFARS
jgi:Fic-DOC domain mobile mystery protein B